MKELENKLKGIIGIAKKAGKIVSGAEQCEKEIRLNKSELIIIAKDISKTGEKAITNICAHYKVRYIMCLSKDELGKIVGAAGDRTVVSVNDKGLADAVLKKYSEVQ